ncbi:MAG: hypothetical protein ABIO65_01485 [Nitrospiria bacterium]
MTRKPPAILHMKINPALKAALEAEARKTNRSTANLIETMLLDQLGIPADTLHTRQATNPKARRTPVRGAL